MEIRNPFYINTLRIEFTLFCIYLEAESMFFPYVWFISMGWKMNCDLWHFVRWLKCVHLTCRVSWFYSLPYILPCLINILTYEEGTVFLINNWQCHWVYRKHYKVGSSIIELLTASHKLLWNICVPKKEEPTSNSGGRKVFLYLLFILLFWFWWRKGFLTTIF